MAYFDNAATTYPKPQCVYTYMDNFYRNSGGNTGRGNYDLAQSAGSLVANTRKKIQEMLHCPTKQIVFEPTATIALNIILQGLIKNGIRNIYISPFEHNAVTRTLHHFFEEGLVTVTELEVGKNLKYDLEKIRYQFDEKKPELVVVSHASNVIGLVAPVEEIFSVAKKYGAFTLVDMAQTAGLVDCNIGLDTFDFAVFAGHKTMYGPTGISGFVMKRDIDLPVIIFGGTGYESANQNMPENLPEKFEVGTLNIAGVAGLNAAIEWISQQTMEKLYTVECKKRKQLVDLLHAYDFIKLVGNEKNGKYIGIVSCIMDEISSDSAGSIFSEHGIAVRTGLQCAPLAHKFLGTYPVGTIRFSVNYFTSEKDFEELKQVLDYIEGNI